MNETGTVTKVEKDKAYILFKRTSACAKCGACGMLANGKDITISAINNLNVKVDDIVEVEFKTKTALSSSAIAYIFPLVMLFLGVFLGYNIPQTLFEVKDAFAAILGLMFCAVAFLVLKLLNPFFSKKLANVYTIKKIIGE